MPRRPVSVREEALQDGEQAHHGGDPSGEAPARHLIENGSRGQSSVTPRPEAPKVCCEVCGASFPAYKRRIVERKACCAEACVAAMRKARRKPKRDQTAPGVPAVPVQSAVNEHVTDRTGDPTSGGPVTDDQAATRMPDAIEPWERPWRPDVPTNHNA